MTASMRKFFALVSIFAIVFAQAALAAYPCPAQAVQSSVSMPATMPDCDQMDLQAPPLCQKHCQDEKQKPHDGTLDFVVPDFSPAFTARVEQPAPSNAEASISADLRTPPPPLILRNCCLRI